MEVTNILSSSEPLDLDSIRLKISEIECIHNDDETLRVDLNRVLNDCALQLESKVKQIVSECSDFGFLDIDDFGSYVENLKEELKAAEAASAQISDEIEVLARKNIEDSGQLERDLEELKCSLDFISSRNEKVGECANCILHGGDNLNLTHTHGDDAFEIMEIENQIEEKKDFLKSLQHLEYVFKMLDAIEQIEDPLSCLKVTEFDGGCIRLALQTYIPRLEDVCGKQRIEDTAEPSEVNHELLIEVTDGTMEIRSVEMFPGDVYIGDIVDAAKSFRQLYSQLALMETRSPMEWLVRKVKDRVIQCTLRRLAVKNANNNRHSFEYLDKDETVIAHMVGGIDGCIKMSHGWPMSNSLLKLVSLKSSVYHTKELSLAFLSKVEEVVNSLAPHMRQNLSSFADAIEKVLVEQKQQELNLRRVE